MSQNTDFDHLGWLEGVVCGEVDGEEEDAALVGRVGGTHDGCLGHREYLQIVLL